MRGMLMYTHTKVTSSRALCAHAHNLLTKIHTYKTKFVSSKTPIQNLQSLTMLPISSADQLLPAVSL